MTSIRLRYYPSFPLGDLILKKLTESFYPLHIVNNHSADIALIDSNALQEINELKEEKILLINAVVNSSKPRQKPISFHLPFLKKAFLKRSFHYQLDPLIQSYAYPREFSNQVKKQIKQKLEANWEKFNDKIYQNQDKSFLLKTKKVIHIQSKNDILRSSDKYKSSEDIFLKDLPHSILAFNDSELNLIQNKIQDLCRY